MRTRSRTKGVAGYNLRRQTSAELWEKYAQKLRADGEVPAAKEPFMNVPETLVDLTSNASMLAGSCNCATSPAGNMKKQGQEEERPIEAEGSAAGTASLM